MFQNLTIYMRRNPNEYLNLSDFDPNGKDCNECVILRDTDSEYIIILCSFLNHKKIRDKKNVDICELTLDDLKSLAGYNGGGRKQSREKFLQSLGEFMPFIIAKEILDCNRGKVIIDEENKTITFQRRYHGEVYKGFTKPLKQSGIESGEW